MTDIEQLARAALTGPKSAIIEYLTALGVHADMLDRLKSWDDGMDRRATAIIRYKRIREMGVRTREAKAQVAAEFKFQLGYVESLIGGSGHEAARAEVKRRAARAAP